MVKGIRPGQAVERLKRCKEEFEATRGARVHRVFITDPVGCLSEGLSLWHGRCFAHRLTACQGMSRPFMLTVDDCSISTPLSSEGVQTHVFLSATCEWGFSQVHARKRQIFGLGEDLFGLPHQHLGESLRVDSGWNEGSRGRLAWSRWVVFLVLCSFGVGHPIHRDFVTVKPHSSCFQIRMIRRTWLMWWPLVVRGQLSGPLVLRDACFRY